MANETTPTSYATRQLSYVLSAGALPANLPDLVLHQLANDIDATGEPSLVVQVPVHSDLGAAAAGAYGTAITTNTELTHGSAIQFTIVEGALVRGLVLDASIEVKFPGMSGIEMLMQEGSFDQKVGALQEEVSRLASMCLEKYEDDHANLTTGFSNSAGTSATPLSVDDLLSAVYTYDTLEGITRETAWFLWPVQVRDLRKNLLTDGGGLGGAAWADVSKDFIDAAQLPTNGLLGRFLSRPLYQGAHSLRTLSDTNANVNGALIAIGRGDPRPGKGGQLGAIAHARRGWLKTRLDYSAADRGMIVVCSLEYVAGEIRDEHGVRIRTKAT